jgi:hypothetical protein
VAQICFLCCQIFEALDRREIISESLDITAAVGLHEFLVRLELWLRGGGGVCRGASRMRGADPGFMSCQSRLASRSDPNLV